MPPPEDSALFSSNEYISDYMNNGKKARVLINDATFTASDFRNSRPILAYYMTG